MDFADELKALGERVKNLKDQILTEEATKTSFIMPFFQLLGYDIFNPLEFVPEYTADVGIKKGERVDYAILLNGQPSILIEAKWRGENLDKHGSQLFRYFQTTKAKFGILTNGVEYRFFTDLDEPNKMDLKPFFVLDVTNIKDADIAAIKKFHKSNFNVDELFDAAEDLKYSNQIKTLFKKNLEDINDNFANYVLCEVYEGRKTQQVVEKFKPVIKRAVNQFISDLLNERLTSALSRTKDDAEKDNPENKPKPAEETEEKDNRIATTDEERDGYAIIKAILRNVLPVERIFCRDTVNYFGVLCDNKNYKWICRLKVERANKFIIFPDGTPNGKKLPLPNGADSIFDYTDLLTESAKRFIETKQPGE